MIISLKNMKWLLFLMDLKWALYEVEIEFFDIT